MILSHDPLRNFLLCWVCGFLLGACAKSFEHDPKLAAQRAEEFARVTFVRQNLQAGYAMLAESGKRYVPLDKFAETVTRLHPGSYPIKVAATDYEPMAGEKAIYVYLTGTNGSELFFYTITLDGTAATDYRVVRFSRGGGAFGSSSQKQPISRSP